ncbi:phosphodiester glycosidase family protein [Paenibacillus hamazuiensis]|uniref:phosphodiester glycosidase family protein n=1 Tax=Paenibacillus hamazuiensis TaxID=2936508 RepID=UPI00200FDA3F|nr:phosphodiester glycosidase family protein [Paenibacillus hamazuiensis]
MSTAIEFLQSTKNLFRHWSWFKKLLWIVSVLTFLTSSFLFLTPSGANIREFLAETVISTQHRDWAWIFVGAEQRDYMVRKLQASYDLAAAEKQDLGMIQIAGKNKNRKNRTIDELIKVEDISGPFWKGKKMYVYDPTTIKIMTPSKPGEGEKISSMVQRTGAVAGVNAGGFVDPDGLGNGFAPIGPIIAGGDVIYTDQDGSVPQHTVGFTKEGTLVIGKYDIFQLRELGVSEAAMFYPRVIANGKPLITSGDGGWGRGPRTAVGQKADGTVIFVVVDGRQAHSVGATLKEIQDLLLEEGCINAGFLDGGASSELVVNGDVVTKPSSRYGERRLPSAFLVYDHPEDVHAPRVWDNVTKIDPGGAYDHPDFLREQAQLKANQAKNPPAAKNDTPAGEKPESSGAKTEAPGKTETPKSGENGTGTKPGETGGAAKPGGASEPKGGEPAGSGSKPAAGTTGGTASPEPTKPAQGGAPAGGGSGAQAPAGQPAGSGGTGTGAAGGTAAPNSGGAGTLPSSIGPGSPPPSGGTSSGAGAPAAGAQPTPAPTSTPAPTPTPKPDAQAQTQTQQQPKTTP